ncbi:MAG: hypothetical protein EXS32_05785 [Opitutus sp.]|nr:hypothetical protein [Betaproteobacteria bacterium]MSU23320.1 hypothetical protein [Opitutus sp.]
MPAILIKDVPPALHRRLKQHAVTRRRSLQQEAMLALERGLDAHAPIPRNTLPPPVPIRLKVPLTDAFLAAVKRERNARR